MLPIQQERLSGGLALALDTVLRTLPDGQSGQTRPACQHSVWDFRPFRQLEVAYEPELTGRRRSALERLRGRHKAAEIEQGALPCCLDKRVAGIPVLVSRNMPGQARRMGQFPKARAGNRGRML